MPKKTQKQRAPGNRPLSQNAQAFLHTLAVLAYIGLVAFIMTNGEAIFGGNDNKTVLAPIAFLLLFTLSAAIMGLLIFGRPVMLYLDGKKKEAMEFVAATVGFLFIEAVLVFIVVAIVNA